MKHLFSVATPVICLIAAGGIFAQQEGPAVVTRSVTFMKPGTRIILGDPQEGEKAKVEDARLSNADIISRAEAEKNISAEEGKIIKEAGIVDAAPVTEPTEQKVEEVVVPEQSQVIEQLPASPDEKKEATETEEIPAAMPAEAVSLPQESIQESKPRRVKKVRAKRAGRSRCSRRTTCPNS